MHKNIKNRIEKIRNDHVPDGFKRTKQGILPKQWTQEKIMNVLTKVGNPVVVEPDKEYVQIGIRSHGKGLFYKEPVSGNDLGNKAVFWIEPHCFVVNIVFAWEQAIGITSEKEVGLIGSHRFPMYSPINNKVDIEYLLHFFMTQRGKDILEEASPGGAGRNKTLGQDRFAKSEIVLPQFAEQVKIAEILNHCDKVIEIKCQLINEEQNRKKWLIQNLLSPDSGVRLKGFTGEWKKFKLIDNGKTYGGLSGKSACDFGHGKPYIPYLNIFQNYIINDDCFDYVNIVQNETQNKVEYGDIFFTTSSETPEDVGMSAVYLGHSEELYLNSFSFGLRFNSFDAILPIFASYYFSGPYIKKLLYRLAQGSTRYNLSKSELLKQTIYLPPTIDEQYAIANIISVSDKKIGLLEQELTQWQKKKKSLMQLLLTGIVQVSV